MSLILRLPLYFLLGVVIALFLFRRQVSSYLRLRRLIYKAYRGEYKWGDLKVKRIFEEYRNGKKWSLDRNILAKWIKTNRQFHVDDNFIEAKKIYDERLKSGLLDYVPSPNDWVTIMTNGVVSRGEMYSEYNLTIYSYQIGLTHRVKEISDDYDGVSAIVYERNQWIKVGMLRPALEGEIAKAKIYFSYELAEKLANCNKRALEQKEELIESYDWLNTVSV